MLFALEGLFCSDRDPEGSACITVGARLLGHGEPVLVGASDAVGELAASLG